MSESGSGWLVTHDGVVFNLRKFELPIKIGRSDDVDIIVKHDTLSRIHALIDYHDDAHYVADNKSQNGTWVDGIVLIAGQEGVLSEGSEIMVGRVKLKYFRDGVNAARHAGSLRE